MISLPLSVCLSVCLSVWLPASLSLSLSLCPYLSPSPSLSLSLSLSLNIAKLGSRSRGALQQQNPFYLAVNSTWHFPMHNWPSWIESTCRTDQCTGGIRSEFLPEPPWPLDGPVPNDGVPPDFRDQSKLSVVDWVNPSKEDSNVAFFDPQASEENPGDRSTSWEEH